MILLILAAWFTTGWCGYLLTRWWWTAYLDWTENEHWLGVLWVLLGPLNLLIGGLLALTAIGGESPRALKPQRGGAYRVDMRSPGESFCGDCPDHEGCMQGIPCELVKQVHREANR